MELMSFNLGSPPQYNDFDSALRGEKSIRRSSGILAASLRGVATRDLLNARSPAAREHCTEPYIG
jgi:hypothetical protein